MTASTNVITWLPRKKPPFARKVTTEILFAYPDEVIERSIRGIEKELKTCPEDKRLKLLKVLHDLQAI